jgi:hypothetical protein
MSSSTSGEGSHLTVLVKEDEEDVNPFADPSLTAANVYDVVPPWSSCLSEAEAAGGGGKAEGPIRTPWEPLRVVQLRRW